MGKEILISDRLELSRYVQSKNSLNILRDKIMHFQSEGA
jgi:hypothetical protein